MDHRNSKAAIVIGDEQLYDPVDMEDCDVYYFPVNITEWELADEVEHLKEFYEIIVLPIWWPPHIRADKVMKWING